MFEAYIVGGLMNLFGLVDYDEYFGIVLTTIETETCITTASTQSEHVDVSRVNPITFQLFEEEL